MTDQPQSSALRGAIYALLAFAAFSSHDVVVKILGATYSPFQIIFFTVLFGFPVLTIMMIADKQGGSMRPVMPWWTAARTLANTLAAGCVFFAFSQLPLTQVYPILFATPLLVTVLAIPMLGERVGIHRISAVLVGLVGVVVVMQPGQAELTLAHAAALVGAIAGAFASIIMRKIGSRERVVVVQLYPLIVNFVLMGALLPFVYVPVELIDMAANAVAAALALAATGFLFLAYRSAPAVIVAPMQYSQIIWASIFGVLIFGETLERVTIYGTAIIILSGLYIVLREDKKPGSTQPVLRTRSRAATPGAPRLAPWLHRKRDKK